MARECHGHVVDIGSAETFVAQFDLASEAIAQRGSESRDDSAALVLLRLHVHVLAAHRDAELAIGERLADGAADALLALRQS